MEVSRRKAKSRAEVWGEFRFSVIGALLSAPPESGELRKELDYLAGRTWKHPISGNPVTLGRSTIERWYYRARGEKLSPVQGLSSKVRSDSGTSPVMSDEAKESLRLQYGQHPSWSYQLHADNLKVILSEKGTYIPSYQSVCRYMHRMGYTKRPSTRAADRAGYRRALIRLESFEVRSYESEYVGSLFHLDFHHCRRQIILSSGERVTPLALTIMDDCSRFICHIQWYLAERTEELVHGVIQAFMKVGLPRALMSDNGGAMLSAEFTEGLSRLGILHNTTLPYSPYMNGKQERFHQALEGRLVALLDGVKDLSLKRLNDATQAWVTLEHHRTTNRELGVCPSTRFLEAKQVLRPAPSFDDLRASFRRRVVRRQRQSDGTVSLNGTRFEIPGRFRSFPDFTLAYALWDLSFVHIIDPASGNSLAQVFPVDKTSNASSDRRRLYGENSPQVHDSDDPLPPLLRKILSDYAELGLPPVYLPKDEDDND